MRKPPGHTCSQIDRLGVLVRRCMRGEDRREALRLLEELRGANLGLREAYADAVAALASPGGRVESR